MPLTSSREAKLTALASVRPHENGGQGTQGAAGPDVFRSGWRAGTGSQYSTVTIAPDLGALG